MVEDPVMNAVLSVVALLALGGVGLFRSWRMWRHPDAERERFSRSKVPGARIWRAPERTASVQRIGGLSMILWGGFCGWGCWLAVRLAMALLAA